MPKLIREGRFGPPKTFKTGAVVGTYPRPMLVLECDEGGLDIIPKTPTAVPGQIKLDVTYGDITFIKPDALSTHLVPTSPPPPILCVDFSDGNLQEIPCDGLAAYNAQPNVTAFPNVIRALNQVIRRAKEPATFPWRTVVFDNTTSFSRFVYGHIAAVNSGAFSDARKWAPMIGNKVAAVIQELCHLPAHVVVIMHESTDKNEVTGEVRTEPMIYSQYRQIVGGELSSFFYQRRVNGVPKIVTSDNGFIKGLGARWPVLPNECGVTFEDIYGAAVKNGEVER